MKKPLFSALVLTAIVLLAAVPCVACSDLEGTALVVNPLLGSTTSSPTPTSVTGETTTAASGPAGTTTGATAGGTAGGTAGATATTRAPAPPGPTTTAAPVIGEPPALTTTRFEDNHPDAGWEGHWVVVNDPYDSGGTSRYAQGAGESMKFHFNGMSVTLIARIGPAVGLADIEIDGVYQTTLDLYSGDWGYSKQVWTSPTLAFDYHDLKVTVVGSSNPASASPGIYVDAFDVLGAGM